MVYIYTATVYITEVFINAYIIYARLAGGQKLNEKRKPFKDIIFHRCLDGDPTYQTFYVVITLTSLLQRMKH